MEHATIAFRDVGDPTGADNLVFITCSAAVRALADGLEAGGWVFEMDRLEENFVVLGVRRPWLASGPHVLVEEGRGDLERGTEDLVFTAYRLCQPPGVAAE